MNYRGNRNWLFLLVSLLVLGALVLMTRANRGYIENNPGGGTDFLIHWVSLRGFLSDDISPYSDEAAERTQRLVYGRLARSGEDPLRMVTPLYVAVPFFPYALIPDPVMARAVWMTTLEVALILLAYFSVRLAGWRPNLGVLGLFFLFSIFWYHSAQPLVQGDLIILVALFFVGAMVAIQNGMDELAGFLLAFTTIKVSVILFPLIFVMIWAGGQRRWRIFWWILGSVVLLGAVAALLLPNWILQNLWQVFAFLSYGPPGTIRSVFLEWLPSMGGRLGWALMGLLALIMVVEWFIFRRADFRGFYWTACLTLVAGTWVGPYTDPGNFVVLLPVLVLVFAMWEERWKRGGRILSLLSLIGLFGGTWALALSAGSPDWATQPPLVLFIPLPLFLLITLYWVRWWAVRPPTVWFDLVYERENPGRL